MIRGKRIWRFEKRQRIKLGEAFSSWEIFRTLCLKQSFLVNQKTNLMSYTGMYIKWGLKEIEDRLVYLVRSHIHHNVPLLTEMLLSLLLLKI